MRKPSGPWLPIRIRQRPAANDERPTTNDDFRPRLTTALVSRAQQIHIQPNCSRNAGRQLAEESVSGVDIGAFAVLRPQQAAFEWLLAWIMR